MRSVFLSWPAKAVVLAGSAIWMVGVASAAPETKLVQSELGTGGGWDMYPTGTIPVPPKPKACECSEAGAEEYPTGQLPIPPKPKAQEDGDAGVDAYPSGTIPIPPKPKAREDGETGLDSFPSGTIPVPPKPKSTIQY